LQSQEWRWIKHRLTLGELGAGRYVRCAVCASTQQIDIHHRTYAHLGDELHHLEDLVPLCKACHKLFHGKLAAAKQAGAEK
jgi:hypothetical protein